jgi:multidrug efflux system membrane fusion protein
MNAQLDPSGRPDPQSIEPIGLTAPGQHRYRAWPWAWTALGLLLLAGAARTHVNSVHATAIAQETRQNAVRAVLFAQPELAKGQRSLALPATLRGAQESPVHARTSGYVRSLHKDIGDRVRQGELLATLDTPEVDQDLAQARASVQQVQARLTLSQTSLSRVESLRNSDAVSQQELDERRAAFQSAQADLASARANVQRLEALQRFGRIVAPFDGVVVRRGVEVGALVAAGSATTNRELFYLAHDQALRLTVAVPQGFIEGVKVGQEVGLKLAERPQAKLTGQVQRIAGGLDAATRSVQVEVAVDNRDGKLKPGGYVEVAWQLSGAKPTLLLPPTAFQFRQDGPRVAVISADQTLSLQPVKLGRDLGKAIEVVEGLDEGQAVVLNPPDTIQAGEKVRAKEAPKEAPKDAPKDASKAPSRHKA